MKYYIRFVLYAIVSAWVSLAVAGSYDDFFKAVNLDLAGTVKDLLARGFDPNSPDQRGNTGLILAMKEGSPKVATVLLAHPQIKVDAANAAGETAVMMAALQGEKEWTQRLLEHGAQVNREGWTPLHYAASGPEPQIVALLLDRGANIDATSPNGNTPLMMAAGFGALDGAALLLTRGANVRARNESGMTAADFARKAGRDRLAARLEAAARQ